MEVLSGSGDMWMGGQGGMGIEDSWRTDLRPTSWRCCLCLETWGEGDRETWGQGKKVTLGQRDRGQLRDLLEIQVTEVLSGSGDMGTGGEGDTGTW